MFGSPFNVTDTMFTDTTMELVELPYNITWWEDFAYMSGGDFIRMLNETDPDDCRAGATKLSFHMVLITMSLITWLIN